MLSEIGSEGFPGSECQVQETDGKVTVQSIERCGYSSLLVYKNRTHTGKCTVDSLSYDSPIWEHSAKRRLFFYGKPKDQN